jgi:hypothetical protein
LDLETKEALEELDNLQKMREEEELLIRFSRDKREAFRQLFNIIKNFPFGKKQRLLDGMLAYPMEIFPPPPWPTYAEASDEDIAVKQTWMELHHLEFRFNIAILEGILGGPLPADADGNPLFDPDPLTLK